MHTSGNPIPVPVALPYYRNPASLPGPLPTPAEMLNAPPSARNFGPGGGICRVRSYVVKFGTSATENEGNALLFAERHLKVPAPRLCAMYRACGVLYVVMEYVRAWPLSAVWATMSTAARASLADELGDCLAKMHGASPPSWFVGGVCGGDTADEVLNKARDSTTFSGPFRNSQEVAVGLAVASHGQQEWYAAAARRRWRHYGESGRDDYDGYYLDGVHNPHYYHGGNFHTRRISSGSSVTGASHGSTHGSVNGGRMGGVRMRRSGASAGHPRPNYLASHLPVVLGQHCVKFAHGNISPDTILVERIPVDADGNDSGFEEPRREHRREGRQQQWRYKLRAVVDWEAAGWYPAYWEYCTAVARTHEHPAWPRFVGSIMDVYRDEAALFGSLLEELGVER